MEFLVHERVAQYKSHPLWLLLTAVMLCVQPVQQDCGHLHPVLRAAVVPASLRLRHASGEVCADGGREPEAEVHGWGRVRAAPQGHQRRQPAQVLVPGQQQLSGALLLSPFVSSCPFLSCLALSCLILLSSLVLSCSPCLVLLWRVSPCLVLLCCVLSCIILLSHLVLSCLILLSYLVLYHLAVSSCLVSSCCLILSCLVLSHLAALSCLVSSCLISFFSVSFLFFLTFVLKSVYLFWWVIQYFNILAFEISLE